MEQRDLDAVEAIEQKTFSDPWSRQSFSDTLGRPETIYLAAEEENTIIGYCGLWGVLEEGQITNVAVEESHRGMGVGRQLMEKLLEMGRREGYTEFVLEVRMSNETAISLYKTLGFEPVGIRKNFYKKPVEHAVIMHLSNNYH